MASHGIRSATKNAARATTPNTRLILGRDWKTTRTNTSDTRYARAASAMPAYRWRGSTSTWDSFGTPRKSLADSLRRLRLARSSRPTVTGDH